MTEEIEPTEPVEYRLCGHCGEPMRWEDMFGIFWCDEMYFGIKKEGI